MSQPYLPPTSVDVSQLDQAALVLDQIQQFVEAYCLGAMPAIAEALGPATNVHSTSPRGADSYSFTRGATFFGGFFSAYGVQERNDSAYRTIQQNLQELIERLGQAAEATRTIAQNYRTVEERNRAMGEDIERVLSGYELTPPGTSAPATSTPTVTPTAY